jgi:hypothetical protein
VFLQGTNLCEYTNPTMLTLDLLNNGMMGAFLTISSVHKMSSILTQFQLLKKSELKKNNKNNERDIKPCLASWFSKP